ncbi:MAG: hypothetical protein H6711_26895 [Myxococcales bacterium]|nr:hypothetical protein [Myxococcales bacterium]
MRPAIDYRHVLKELSVNRQDPCEVVRELVSNAYDAGATQMWLAPVLQQRGLIFFDSGTGVDPVEKIRDITPWQAFFSIGRSTKIPGQKIGYKCQGTKLCFASNAFALGTRVARSDAWYTKIVDNPKQNLTESFDITPNEAILPHDLLRTLFPSPDSRTEAILSAFDEDFFRSFPTGTLVAIRGFEAEDFNSFFTASTEHPYLISYIQFCTRHGDMRILNHDQFGFKKEHETLFREGRDVSPETVLHVWGGDTFKVIPAGYPYISRPTDQEAAVSKPPASVARLRDGRFVARHAKKFKLADSVFCITLAVDGNRRALEHYPQLGRRGSRRSGIRLTDNRGTFVCAQGVKVCPYNEIFESEQLTRYSELMRDSGQAHFVLLIDGHFSLVTNRNSLAEESLKVLRSPDFLGEIRKFLDAAYGSDSVVRQLVDRLQRESEQFRLERYSQQHDGFLADLPRRERFQILEGASPLKNEWFFSPSSSEEHWVGTMYALFGWFAPEETFPDLWLKVRTYSGVGIDSLAAPFNEGRVTPEVHQSVEYKWRFDPDGEYNHPLILTDLIVAWELSDGVADGDTVQDQFGYWGKIELSTELEGLGFCVRSIENREGDYSEHIVRVISLRKLLDATFKIRWVSPPESPARKK